MTKLTFLWLWMLATVLVCLSPQALAEPFTDSRILQPQDNSLLGPVKRTKPSLSIVNPLDVLRQRIILEMARRQMRENTRQVERNRDILREIGKRSHGATFAVNGNDYDESGGPRFADFFYPASSSAGLGIPILRRYGGSRHHPAAGLQLDDNTMMEFSLGPESELKDRSGDDRSSSGRIANDDEGKQQVAGQIPDDETRSSSNSVLTLAEEQRRLERAGSEQPDTIRNRRPTPQELMTFQNEHDRVLLPLANLATTNNRGGDGISEFDSLLKDDDSEQQQQQQQQAQLRKLDERQKSEDDYRLRYLYNMQGKVFG
ncbi:uncharacterized protein LOC129758154 [Uranotaenia lowii]|uniref:uncharacterized protein LOC129758154 n=1 Tax=Uranotaenia lowii TaxID=190385 RepID=UPI0024784681|nr:uncharacterized protein LOC129758154 [Uranotaenia lowii]XP_055611591.1 uncharacterized protein LOC129758154 [Uranotaenia lowii]